MCRIAAEDGTRWIAATAHQNPRWPDATLEAIQASVARLTAHLRESGSPLCLRPVAEVMLTPEVLENWDAGRLLSYSDQGEYLLVEFPPGAFFDLRPLARQFRSRGVRLVLAHPERQPELLHHFPRIQQLIQLGCLVQVSASSFCAGRPEALAALKNWVRAGVVHLVGSDGHSPQRRPPCIAEAYRRIAAWVGPAAADRICCSNGLAVLEGLPLRTPVLQPPRRRRFLWFG